MFDFSVSVLLSSSSQKRRPNNDNKNRFKIVLAKKKDELKKNYHNKKTIDSLFTCYSLEDMTKDGGSNRIFKSKQHKLFNEFRKENIKNKRIFLLVDMISKLKGKDKKNVQEKIKNIYCDNKNVFLNDEKGRNHLERAVADILFNCLKEKIKNKEIDKNIDFNLDFIKTLLCSSEYDEKIKLVQRDILDLFSNSTLSNVKYISNKYKSKENLAIFFRDEIYECLDKYGFKINGSLNNKKINSGDNFQDVFFKSIIENKKSYFGNNRKLNTQVVCDIMDTMNLNEFMSDESISDFKNCNNMSKPLDKVFSHIFKECFIHYDKLQEIQNKLKRQIKLENVDFSNLSSNRLNGFMKLFDATKLGSYDKEIVNVFKKNSKLYYSLELKVQDKRKNELSKYNQRVNRINTALLKANSFKNDHGTISSMRRNAPEKLKIALTRLEESKNIGDVDKVMKEKIGQAVYDKNLGVTVPPSKLLKEYILSYLKSRDTNTEDFRKKHIKFNNDKLYSQAGEIYDLINMYYERKFSYNKIKNEIDMFMKQLENGDGKLRSSDFGNVLCVINHLDFIKKNNDLNMLKIKDNLTTMQHNIMKQHDTIYNKLKLSMIDSLLNVTQ